VAKFRRSIGAAASRIGRVFAAVTITILTSMRHARWGAGGWNWAILNNTGLNYEGLVHADLNSIVQAAVRWAQRNFGEAPPLLEQWNAGRGDYDQHPRDEMLELLRRPNPYYSGKILWQAIIGDLMVGDGGGGNAYCLKVRSETGRVLQLWWAPAHLMQPVADENDPTVFISHYEYTAGDGPPLRVRVEDVIHFRDGLDPNNPRKGMAPMKSLFREIFTDDEAANMTASLLRNMGVPGVIIAPENGTISQQAAEEIKRLYMAKTTGDNRGEPLVMAGAMKLTQFGFSPEQMQLRNLRGIPEERITALIGINSAVLGLGAGLATTKVGATLKEYREEATESFMVPMWQNFGETITHQLLSDFKPAGWQMVFDLSRVRVLQEDENKRAEHLASRLATGAITVAEYRRSLGMIALPEHEVYLRPKTLLAVPAGTSPEDQAAMTAESKAGSGSESTLDAEAAVAAAEEAVRE
jgi:HK97 family phage portal protein